MLLFLLSANYHLWMIVHVDYGFFLLAKCFEFYKDEA
jgi:hypothetical protein